jgi:hypothetical protein
MTRKNASVLPRPLHPSDLVMAPELAALSIVEGALQTALLALCAAHPTLQDFAEPGEPLSLRRARRLVSAAANLDRVLDRYRSAVYDAITPLPPSHDDLPF